MKLKIEDLKKVPFTAKSGDSYVRLEIKANGQNYSCLEGRWNQTWAVGQEIEANVQQETFKGQIQNKIKPPEKTNSPVNGELVETIRQILQNTKTILEMLAQTVEYKKSPNTTGTIDIPLPEDKDLF